LTTLPCEFTKSQNAIYSAVEYKIYPRSSSTEDPLHSHVDPPPPASEEEGTSVETSAELIKDSRKYCLELLPKLYYFKSDTIELVSQCKLDALTDVRDGIEFYPVKGIYMFRNNGNFVKVCLLIKVVTKKGSSDSKILF